MLADISRNSVAEVVIEIKYPFSITIQALRQFCFNSRGCPCREGSFRVFCFVSSLLGSWKLTAEHHYNCNPL